MPTKITNVDSKPIPPDILVAGKTTIVNGNVPQGVTELDLSIDVAQHLNPSVTLRIEAEISQDGGSTWEGGGSTDLPGGTKDDDLKPLITLPFTVGVNNPANANRKCRVHVTCLNSVTKQAAGSFVLGGGALKLNREG